MSRKARRNQAKNGTSAVHVDVPKPVTQIVETPVDTDYEVFFNSYANKEEGVIAPEGVEKFCKDLGVNMDDLIVLILAWKLNAAEMGVFTKSEFIEGMKILKASSIYTLKNKLPTLNREIETSNTFSQLYKYAFDFSRENKQSKTVEKEIAIGMLSLLMGSKAHATNFNEFLKKI